MVSIFVLFCESYGCAEKNHRLEVVRCKERRRYIFFVILYVWVYQQECLDKNIKYFCYIFVKNIRDISYVTTRTFAPVGAPRRPESPSDDIVVGRASFR